MTRRIDAIVVAIPARDEAARLPGALASVRRAADAVAADDAPPRVVVALAADACRDETAAVARRAGALVVESSAGRVGAARAAAIATGLAALDAAPDATWIACTDADVTVPERWLAVHLAAARAGVDLLLGSVRPSTADLDPAELARWAALNPPSETHPYIHGANLGVRADVYRAAGGFAALAVGEDVGLADAVRLHGGRVTSTDEAPVTVSGRVHGRAPGGFADYLLEHVLGTPLQQIPAPAAHRPRPARVHPLR